MESSSLGLPPYRVWPGGKGNGECGQRERVRGLRLGLPGRGGGGGLVTLVFLLFHTFFH